MNWRLDTIPVVAWNTVTAAELNDADNADVVAVAGCIEKDAAAVVGSDTTSNSSTNIATEVRTCRTRANERENKKDDDNSESIIASMFPYSLPCLM